MIERGSLRFRLAGWLSVVLLLIAAVPAVCAVSPASAEDATSTGNRVFFRGGYAQLSSDRSNELFTDGHSTLGTGPSNGSSTGYYVGAGTDLMLTKDVWGMMKNIAVVGEIGVEYKRWNSNTVANSDTGSVPVTGVSTGGTTQVQLTMLTVSVSPKVKFMQGSDFQPWVIPVGLDFHVISPPSNQTQYLDIGVQFGAGAEYRIWKELWVGADSRYHVASNQTNTVNNFWTIGPYIAIGF
ncbi:MAG: outer membrane beta-barrel protein [Nitrospirae bacterium]|nr:outer membrane beta-barrel protein [Nitrospirota bacterium]